MRLPPAAQLAGRLVAHEPQRVDRGLHPPPGALADQLGPVEHVGHRAEGHPGPRGDVLHARCGTRPDHRSRLATVAVKRDQRLLRLPAGTWMKLRRPPRRSVAGSTHALTACRRDATVYGRLALTSLKRFIRRQPRESAMDADPAPLLAVRAVAKSFGAVAAVARRVVPAVRRRGARAGRGERRRQVHARQDAGRRAPPRHRHASSSTDARSSSHAPGRRAGRRHRGDLPGADAVPRPRRSRRTSSWAASRCARCAGSTAAP